MNNFNMISKILTEAEENMVQPATIKNDPAILRVKKRAEALRAKADLLGAHNQIKKVKIDSDKIDAERAEHEREMEKKAAGPARQDELGPVI